LLKIVSGIILGPKEKGSIITMTTSGPQKNVFLPFPTPGKTPPSKCLCPEWMCWMPWLADGEELIPELRKNEGQPELPVNIQIVRDYSTR
jgi:hypothetical protein